MMVWSAVPAAGVGKRMGTERPKQYLALCGKPVIQHTLERLLTLNETQGAVVAISAEDEWWAELGLSEKLSAQFSKLLLLAEGGAERFHTVLNALDCLSEIANQEDWVMVHDAARPCVPLADLQKMVQELANTNHLVGGILAAPVTDTIKQSDDAGNIEKTVDRSSLWRALTPQMFRLGMLRDALQSAIMAGKTVTDEAQAMELAGYTPYLVEGSAENIKITHPGDLIIAEQILGKV